MGHSELDVFEDTSADATLDLPDNEVESDLGRDLANPLCESPNPHLAVVSEELIELRDWMIDGSFESGQAPIEVLPHPQQALTAASWQPSANAARTGSTGIEVTAGEGEGLMFGVRAATEKGEDLRFSMWVRSPNGPTRLRATVLGVDTGGQTRPAHGPEVDVGVDWTELTVETSFTLGFDHLVFGVAVGPDTTVQIDDARTEYPQWLMAEYAAGESRRVGTIDVPIEPRAPVHFNVLIHIEDPEALHLSEDFFHGRTAVFVEIARILHDHGGFLTIQPEHDWAQAAEAGMYPGLLRELAQDFDGVYSNHTHGPNCVDPDGTLRSAADCNSHPEWSTALDDDDVVQYAAGLAQLLGDASGTAVTDHNGIFDFAHLGRLNEVGIRTISAYKSYNDQRTYDRFIINPWRPTDGDAVVDVERFLRHDPATNVIEPLVAEGYLQWTPMDEIADRYVEWEACRFQCTRARSRARSLWVSIAFRQVVGPRRATVLFERNEHEVRDTREVSGVARQQA